MGRKYQETVQVKWTVIYTVKRNPNTSTRIVSTEMGKISAPSLRKRATVKTISLHTSTRNFRRDLKPRQGLWEWLIHKLENVFPETMHQSPAPILCIFSPKEIFAHQERQTRSMCFLRIFIVLKISNRIIFDIECYANNPRED